MKKYSLLHLFILIPSLIVAQPSYFLSEVLRFQSDLQSIGFPDELVHKRNALQREFGLSLVSSVQHRFGEGLIEEDLSIQNLQTNYRAGIEWEIFRDGWLSNSSEVSQLNLEIEFEKITDEERRQELISLNQISFIEYLFNKQIVEILLSRKESLYSKESLFRNLLREGYVTGNQWADFESRKNEIQFLLSILEESKNTFEIIFENELSTFSNISMHNLEIPILDTSRIFEVVEQSTILEQKLNLEQGLVDKPFSWDHKIRLTANITYYHQESFSNDRRDFTAAGLRLQIPLANQSLHQKAEYESTLTRLESQYEYEMLHRKRMLYSLISEYQRNRKSLNDLRNDYQVINQLENTEYLERSSVNTDMPIIDLSLYTDDKLINKIHQYEIINQLFKLLIRIDLLLENNSIIDFVIYENNENSLIVRGMK